MAESNRGVLRVVIRFDDTNVLRVWGVYKTSFPAFYYANQGVCPLKPLIDKGFNIFLI
jgi:hypothetical protein